MGVLPLDLCLLYPGATNRCSKFLMSALSHVFSVLLKVGSSRQQKGEGCHKNGGLLMRSTWNALIRSKDGDTSRFREQQGD